MRNETRQASQQLAGIRQQFSRELSTEPPIGGWNTRDSLDNIPPEDAILLDNFTCGFGSIRVRLGSAEHSYSTTVENHVASPVKTLMKFESGGTRKMLAADGSAIWDATAGGPASAVLWSPSLGGKTSDVWSWVNFRGSADVGLLVMVNGSFALQYNGTAISTLTPALDPVITPIGCAVFKNRVYYWEAGSQSVWYTELYAHAGVITEFPLGDVGSFGGDLVSVQSWTHDGGHGIDDYIMFIMSSGEVLTYQGSFPADEADWALVGIYNPGRALGPRSFTKFGGDLYMMTDLDIVPMSQLMAGVEQNKQRTKISGAMQTYAARIGQFGFEAVLFAPSKLAIFNCPGDNVNEFDQLVMNTVTGAWSRWKDRGAYCWLEFLGKLYYGSEAGVVYQAETGFRDSQIVSIPGGGREPAQHLPDAPEAGATYDFVYGLGCYPGQAQVEIPDMDPYYWLNVSQVDRFGNQVGPALLALTVGTQIIFRAVDGTPGDKVYEIAVLPYTVFCATQQVYRINIKMNLISGSGYYTNGEQVQVVVGGGGTQPPDPGDPGSFIQLPIQAQAQTSWLRFGVEENKQFDAAKLFFRSGVPVPHVMSFAVDYQNPPIPDYPESVRGFGVPWSGEWTPSGDPPSPPATIPDPTTWWTDEGSNPPTPVNAVTGESSVGAITKWGLEAQTTERWEVINGYGRAISMLIRTATEEFSEWTLTFWHIKLGSRM